MKLLGLSETTEGENMLKAFLNTVSELDIGETIFVSAPSMVGSNGEPLAVLPNAIGQPAVPFHHILHYRALKSQSQNSGATDESSNCSTTDS